MSAGKHATPTEKETFVCGTERSSAFFRRPSKGERAATLSTPTTSSANSSPPRRAATSPLRKRGPELGAHRLKGRVAGGVTVVVVDNFEIVQVEQHQGERPTVTARPAHCLAQEELVTAPVEEAGQGVVAGVVHQEVQAQRQLDQAGNAGRRHRADDGRVGVKALVPGEGGTQMGRQRPAFSTEGRPPEAEDLRSVGSRDHYHQVPQPVPGGHEIQGLVDELEPARRAS